MMKELNAYKSASSGTDARRGNPRSEKGVVLVMVIVLSAVALLVMTTLIYLITSGTQVSGLQKRFKTALEAGEGGADIFYQLLALRGSSSDTTAFINNLSPFSINVTSTTPVTCGGTSDGASYTGLTTKFKTPSTSWVNCNSSLSIDTADPSTYDMMVQLGATTRYNVYAKIVSTTLGNTGADTGLQKNAVVSGGSGSGEVPVAAVPYLYAIEVVSVNSSRIDERAKLSILYEY